MTISPEWMRQAACLGRGKTMHVPDDTDLKAVWAARDICNQCPVLEPCNDYALALTAADDSIGDVMAGLTWQYRRNRRAAAATARAKGRPLAGGAAANWQAAQERSEALASLLDKGVEFGQACDALGIPKSTGHRYLKRLDADRADEAEAS